VGGPWNAPHRPRFGAKRQGPARQWTGAGAWATGRATPSIAAVPDQRAMRAGHGSPTGSLSPLPRMRTVSELKNGSTRVASGVDAWPSRRAIVGLHRGSVKARHSAPPACAAAALTDPRRSPDRQLRDGHGVVLGQNHCRITSQITTRTNGSTKQCEDDGMNNEQARTADRFGDTVWLTLRRAAARAAVSEATIKREVSRGRIRFARVGGRRSLRFRPEWIDAWLDTSTTPIEHTTRPV
jgi:excisionase family DNA binding protein